MLRLDAAIFIFRQKIFTKDGSLLFRRPTKVHFQYRENFNFLDHEFFNHKFQCQRGAPYDELNIYGNRIIFPYLFIPKGATIEIALDAQPILTKFDRSIKYCSFETLIPELSHAKTN